MTAQQKILIVDDEPRNQRIIIEILDDLVEFKVASSGEEALTMIESFHPDLVLLDIMMPGIDGYEVCRRIRANPDLVFTKIILVSGKAMVEERLKGYGVGADDYMTKPFEAEELLAKAKVFLRLTSVERDLTEMNRELDHKVQIRTQQLLEAESKLVTNAKMSALGEMAGGMAHEINTPLAIIRLTNETLAEAVTDGIFDEESLINMTETIDKTVKRISTIINGLRTFSRDSGKDPFTLTPVREIVESTLALCSEKLKNNGIELRMDPIPADLEVFCQSVQISQVLLNLIGNACDAIESTSERWIRISAERQGDGVLLSVTDSGKGVSEAARDKIFEPFFTTKEVGKGTGLGLSISKGIISGHKGSLNLNTESENTRFDVRLPRGTDSSLVA